MNHQRDSQPSREAVQQASVLVPNQSCPQPLALYSGKDVATRAATGAGKTLSFRIALLMALEES